MQYTRQDLFIKNLSQSTTKTDLMAHFAAVGLPIAHAWLTTHVGGALLQRPFATVKLEVPGDQEKCIAALEGESEPAQ
jgi:hypothetical protein